MRASRKVRWKFAGGANRRRMHPGAPGRRPYNRVILTLVAAAPLTERSYLFVKTSSLGDIVHSMPAVTELARRMAPARIDWVVEETYAPLLRLHTVVNRIIPMAWRRWRSHAASRATWVEVRAFRASLAGSRYDAVIDAQGLVKSAVVALMARGTRCGFDWPSAREGVASLTYARAFAVPWSLHAVQRCRTLAAKVGGYPMDHTLDYGLSLAHRVTDPRPYAVLLHATAQSAKQWDEACWTQVGQAMAASGLRVLLPHGNDAELERSLRLAAGIPSAEVPDRAPLDRLALILSGASVVIGVDTGLLHLAAAMRVPLVGIYLDTDPEATGPVGTGPLAVCGNRGRIVEVAEVLHAIGEVTDIQPRDLSVAD